MLQHAIISQFSSYYFGTMYIDLYIYILYFPTGGHQPSSTYCAEIRNILEASSVKLQGSLARNAFWKLLFLNLEEASREKIILEASSVKFGGSLARNDHFRSFFYEIVGRLV